MSQLLLEYWKPVVGYEGLYEISNVGRINSYQICGRARTMKPTPCRLGYPMVSLHRAGVRRDQSIHRLVAEAFIGPIPPGMQTCHNDGNPANNRRSNLRYDTRSANTLDSIRHGTFHRFIGEAHAQAKLRADQVQEIFAASGKQREIAKRYGITQSQVWRIKRGRCWKHLELTNA